MARYMNRWPAMKPVILYGRKKMSYLTAMPFMKSTDFPSEVYIENTNRCNIHCTICPREKLTRPQGFMDFGLFEKIVKEVSMHRNDVRRLHLHNFGEPLLDKDLAKRVKVAKDCGMSHTYFVTNGSLFTEARAREIIEAGLDEMKFSFYGTDPETYNNTMVGLDFHDTISRVSTFFKTRKELGRKNPKVIIQYIETPTNKCMTKEFAHLVNPFLDRSLGDSFFIAPLYNYGAGRSFIKTGDIARICTFPWRVMIILINGDVVLCAPDYNGDQVVGNVRDKSIREIWHGDAYRKVREDFRGFRYGKYPVCRKCTVVCDTVSTWNE